MNQDSRRIKEFTDLMVWQEGHKLVLETYRVTEILPKAEKFGLASQMQRSVVSITSNIAEGFGRQSYKEKIRFYYLSHGSLTEYKNQLIICRDLGYINKEKFDRLYLQLVTVHKLLQGIIKKSKTFLNPES